MTNHYEKPKDWGVAPQSNWVSGTPIGQSEVKMPSLGDPGSHENASTKVSFGDDGPKAAMSWRVAPGGKRIAPGTPCPIGTNSTKDGLCAPSQSGIIMSQRSIQRQYRNDKDKEGVPTGPDTSFERELPKVATEADPQIGRIHEKGYKGR